MATESKKFNFLAIRKIIALLLCLVSVGIMASQTISTLLVLEKEELTYSHFADALTYDAEEGSVTETQTFRNNVSAYINYISSMVGSYGGGTEQAYKLWKDNLKEYNEQAMKLTKENLLRYIQSRGICYDYLVAEWDGVVTTLGKVGSSDLSDETKYYYIEDVIDEDELEYSFISDGDFSDRESITIYEEIKKAAQELEADGVVKIDYECVIVTDYDYETVIKHYKPGYYAFRINEDELDDYLYAYDILKSGYGENGYEVFKESYDRLALSVEQYYDTGRYFIMDSEGNTYTNMEKLSAKSTREEIIAEFQKLGFFCFEDSAGEMCLPDGRYYLGESVRAYSSRDYIDYDVDYDCLEQYATTAIAPSVYSATTDVYPAMPSTSAAVTVESTAVSVNYDTVSFPQTVESTVSKNVTVDYDADPFIADGDIICFIGVDMNTEPLSEDNCFAGIAAKIGRVEELIKDFLLTCGVLLIQFIICFVYLISVSGRRSGDRERVYLMAGDKIFTEIRLAFDCGLGFLVFLCGVWLFDISDFSSAKSVRLFTAGISICAVIISLLVIDFVLFAVRHIKNKSFFKNLFVVWIVRKPLKLIFSLVHKARAKTAAAIRRMKERFLYINNLAKTVKIRTLLLGGINILVGFIAVMLFSAEQHWSALFLSAALVVIDLFALYKGLVFAGGVHKLLIVIEEMRKGNLEEKINKNALPEYLVSHAENLQGLGDGMKLAVEEAVRQEQTKTELITNVSHDLKTPLTSIINYVDLLKKCDITDETALSYLQVLSEKSDRLKHLISDLVEASKASTGAIAVNFMDVSLRELLNQMLGELEEDFEKRGLNFIVTIPDSDVTVRADSKLLYRVMENLFVNVKKYALENSRVYLNVSEDGGKGIIEIKNISAAPLNISASELKNRFVRGDESRTTEGNGLGLSIAENLCTLQQGKLELEINGDLFVARVEMNKV